EILELTVPNLILQPIVENALRHGIGTRIGPGRIDVIGRQYGRMLRIEIRDDGPGLKEPGRERIGIANTRSRLQQLYGDAYHFEMLNASSGGVVVTLEIPASPQPARLAARA